MADTGELGLNLLLRFMELAGESGVSLSHSDLDPLMDRLGIERGGENHFTLIWAGLQRQRASGAAASVEDLKRLYPHWASKFDGMVALESYLDSVGLACRRKVDEKLRAKGYQVVRELRANQRSLTCLVTPPPNGGEDKSLLIPVVLKAGFGAYQLRLLKREYLLGRTLSPDYFLRPSGIEASDEVAWLTLEYCPMGSLDKAKGLSHADIWRFWTQAAKALALLHQRMVCHNDVKASNLLLDQHQGRSRVRLSDLEHGSREGKAVNRLRDIWDHPEWEPGQASRKRDDVYRLGMTIAWLLAPEIADPANLSSKARLKVVSRLPAPFHYPLTQSLRDESLERIETGAELHRLLNGSKDHIHLSDLPVHGSSPLPRETPA